MNENDYLQQLAKLTGLQHYPKQGPWNKKSGSVVGTLDNYVTAIGFAYNGQNASLVILFRFKKLEQPELVKSALKAAAIKEGRLGAVGNDFVRWEWKYSFGKPKLEEVVQLLENLRKAIRTAAAGLEGRCEHCASTTKQSLTLLNGMPMFICSSCQERMRHELNQAAEKYEMITPNYPNGLLLGLGAAALGGCAWGLIAYGVNRIFLYGAILIGYIVAVAVLRGTGKVTRFGQIIIPVLTIASVLFGDAIFYTLSVMKQEHVPFSARLLNAVVVHLWELEIQGSGVLSVLFALVGAGYALYSARKPKFQAIFQPLGAPNG
jgi:hypothetical protein